MTYLVRNADGIVVAEYGNGEHARESALENAAAGSGAMLDFYSVEREDGEHDRFCVAFFANDDGRPPDERPNV